MITTLRSSGKAAAVAALMALAACAGPPQQSESDRRREQVAQAHQRGSEALARGNYRTALRHYQLTLDRSLAVEDQDESAISMLNIAAVLHRGGNYAVARSTLLALIEHEPPFAAGYVGRAEARLALIELQENRIDQATLHAARAEHLCPPSGCRWRLPLNNILAAIALQRGDFGGAETQARATLAIATRTGERGEEGNAWRLLGEIAARQGRADQARDALLTALAIDRKIEAPERIALDLLALARLELGLGNREAGHGYARRAAVVAEAAELATPLMEARMLLGAANQ